MADIKVKGLPAAPASILKDEEGNELGLTAHIKYFHSSRYKFDGDICAGSDWMQYDTSQDASYFGVWVNPIERMVIQYAEGDVYIDVCKDATTYKKRIQELNEFYGPPPPAFVGIGDDGQVTNYYDESAAHGREIPGV